MANVKVVWGFALVPLAAALIFWAPFPVFAGVVYAACLVGMWEYARMALPGEKTRARRFSLPIGAAVAAAYWFGSLPLVFLALVCAFLAILVFALFFEPETDESLAVAAKLCLGLLYVPVLFGFVILLRRVQEGTHVNWILPLFLVVWIGDSGAYFVGRRWGKRKLFPRISPKKTAEGFAGGLAASLIAALVWNRVVGVFPWPDAALLGLLLGVIGPVGDLVESMLKRATGVKDSGALIPGHGGILDRTDSIIFAAPFLYFFVWFRHLTA